LPPYTTGSVRIRSNLDIKLGRVIGGWQWRAADRRCASRCGHSSRRASGLGVAFVGALCRRIDSQGVDPRSLNWKISSPGKARDRSPWPLHDSRKAAGESGIYGLSCAGRSRPAHGAPALRGDGGSSDETIFTLCRGLRVRWRQSTAADEPEIPGHHMARPSCLPGRSTKPFRRVDEAVLKQARAINIPP
jgi:hypothetical protein